MRLRILYIVITFCVSFVVNICAQQGNYTLTKDYVWGVDQMVNDTAVSFQTFIKPYRYEELNELHDTTVFIPSLFKAIKPKYAIAIPKKVMVQAYPILTTQFGFQSSPNRYLNDVLFGGNILGNIGEKLTFNAKVLAGQGVYNNAIDSVIVNSSVVPGLGYAYGYTSRRNPQLPTYSYQYASGYLSYSPNKVFNLQLGRDKHFWGDGYRSLFLSDVAAPYAFFKVTTSIWKLKYVNLFTAMKDASQASGLKSDRLNKYASFHYLGWDITRRLNVGLFEAVVWQGDDAVRKRGYDITYLNPIMFFRPAEFSLGSSDNVLIGVNAKLKLFKKQQLYGQMLLDEFVFAELKNRTGWWGNKYAFQVGAKSFDMFKLKHLNLLMEYNYARPYTYAHGSSQQNYTHLNQALAHPLGANFKEAVVLVNYNYKRWFIEAKAVYATYGLNENGINYGKDIAISYATNRPGEYGHEITQGLHTELLVAAIRGAYIIDADINLKLETGVALRKESNAIGEKNSPYVFIGIRTDLTNLYDDF